ncbi:phosphomannomutase [Marinomonas balearica]|uniref:Phosphomannomutase n=1 Tax=Marinomonas balearica TaxID=491947 RepID=A0A4R6M3X1_9GAMM|nr:phosphomannomutase [Marinomonas balearica]TDO95998.1 phosphomannomutase [Marinomonas balearica]
MKTLKELSNEADVSFGTSGVRALDTSLTPQINYAYARAFLTQVCPSAQTVAIGIDLRPSSPSIANAMILAAEDLNVEVIYCGELPTPALAYFAMTQQIPGIMVTGSHIPFDRNGFKFYTPHGEITKAHEQAILSYSIAIDNPLQGRSAHEVTIHYKALETFKKRYASIFPDGFLKGKRIGVYEHSSVARDTIKDLLSHFGADVVSLERTDTFIPIDTEAVSKEDQQKALSWSAEYDLAAIVSTDGDGDRPLISDEDGKWLRGDIVGILVSQYLKATHVSCPINANTALELSNPKLVTLRTRIGSPYVIEGMEQLSSENQSTSVVGYEANGGVLTGNAFYVNNERLEALPTRDSVLPIFAILAVAFKANKAISELVNSLPMRFTASDRIKDIPSEKSKHYISCLKEDLSEQNNLLSIFDDSSKVAIKQFNEIDGLRMILSNDTVIHLRPSGNAPELRCYSESDDQMLSDSIVIGVIEKLKAL